MINIVVSEKVFIPKLAYLSFNLIAYIGRVINNMYRRILLLEDDFDTNEIITMIFEPEGFQVISSTVDNYLDDIYQWKPEIVIVDHLLSSRITGSDICIELKANEKTAHIPCVLTSAVNNLPEVAKKCCADRYIEKPFDIDNFVSIVRGLLSSQS